jgi:hypothetical protein
VALITISRGAIGAGYYNNLGNHGGSHNNGNYSVLAGSGIGGDLDI